MVSLVSSLGLTASLREVCPTEGVELTLEMGAEEATGMLGTACAASARFCPTSLDGVLEGALLPIRAAIARSLRLTEELGSPAGFAGLRSEGIPEWNRLTGRWWMMLRKTKLFGNMKDCEAAMFQPNHRCLT